MLRVLRRICQAALFVLFLFLLLETRGVYNADTDEFLAPGPVSATVKLSPLVAVAGSMTARRVVPSVAFGLVVLALTVLVGRAFCGWACPLGSLIDFWDRFVIRKRSKPFLAGRRLKYVILLCVIALAVAGIGAYGYLDPLCIMTRSFSTAVIPGVILAVQKVSGWMSEGRAGWRAGSLFGWAGASGGLLPFRQGVLMLAVLVGILLLGLREKRFWCRNLCPLGALLGVVAAFSPFGRRTSESCDRCRRCAADCGAWDSGTEPGEYRKRECVLCLSCVRACDESALRFGLALPRYDIGGGPDLTRRHLLVSLAALLPMGLLVRHGRRLPLASRLVRPPGSREEPAFLMLCSRCGHCFRACPTQALQPALMEAGLEGMWTPFIVPRIGACDDMCTLCGQVCPTQAIIRLGHAERRKTRIGTAYIDRNFCLPWRKGENCIKCEEHCPTPDKSIILKEEEVVLPSGEKKNVKKPYMVEDRCIGCGICEHVCPVGESPGIILTNDREQRYPSSL